MAWNTDQSPLNYLKRRIKYYKKKRSSIKNCAKNKAVIAQYGEKGVKKLIAISEQRINKRIKEFELAIKKIAKSKTEL